MNNPYRPRSTVAPSQTNNHGSLAADNASQVPIMGRSNKASRATAMVWMNNYLNSDASTSFYNTNYPRNFDKIVWEYVVGENMMIFLNAFGLWLATNKFPTRQNTNLAKRCREEYFKSARDVLKDKFPGHHLFTPGYSSEWFSIMKGNFLTQFDRSLMEDFSRG